MDVTVTQFFDQQKKVIEMYFVTWHILFKSYELFYYSQGLEYSSTTVPSCIYMFDWTNPYIQKFVVSLFLQLIRNSTIKHTTCAISLSSLDMKHCFAVIAFLACLANADVYLHNPRGSNNRCDEKSMNCVKISNKIKESKFLID